MKNRNNDAKSSLLIEYISSRKQTQECKMVSYAEKTSNKSDIRSRKYLRFTSQIVLGNVTQSFPMTGVVVPFE
jgi:hypothetical protein